MLFTLEETRQKIPGMSALHSSPLVIPDDAIASVKKNYVALKGPLAVRFNAAMLVAPTGHTDHHFSDPRR